MSKPRVFISSTYYDLKAYRKDIELFIESIGYEPILNEKGHIPYGKDEHLEEYCYREIENIDILVSIIGGRFGSESQIGSDINESIYSISNIELKTARELNKQAYIFIEKNIDIEYQTYLLNKENKDTIYKYVDSDRIYKFIEEIKSYPHNNIIFTFDNIGEITNILKEQWSGLFHQLLFEESKRKERELLNSINTTAKTLKELVDYLSQGKKDSDENIISILFKNHPAFSQLRQILKLEFPIIFNNFYELRSLLSSLGYRQTRSSDYSKYCFRNINHNTDFDSQSINVSKEIFEEGNILKLYTPETWDLSFISYIEKKIKTEEIDS